jgi:hypothetical protein
MISALFIKIVETHNNASLPKFIRSEVPELDLMMSANH